MVDKDQLFSPTKMSAQAKAEQTNQAAKEILAAEAAAREAKTAKLRLARLEQAAPEAGEKSKTSSRARTK